MLRRKPMDLQINHERWLISYADFVTLLFAFFVVMYSVSQVNEAKLEDLSETLEELFHKSLEIEGDASAQDSSTSEADTKPEKNLSLGQLGEQLSQRLGDLVDQESVDIVNNESWLQITLNNKLLFPLGSVTPSTEAESILEDIAITLADTDNPIQVEGFTDNTAINTSQYPSNWELSSARAVSIVKVLMAYGIEPKRLAAVGYGEFQPIADNTTAEGRAKNRRVVLMIGKKPRVHLPLSNHLSSSNTNPTQPENSAPSEANKTSSGLTPTVLSNGEHLFSSDPDLPRNP